MAKLHSGRWNPQRMQSWIEKNSGDVDVQVIFEPEHNIEQSKDRPSTSAKRGIRIKQDRMIYTRKRKNGCRLASNDEIRRAVALPHPLTDPAVSVCAAVMPKIGHVAGISAK